jgi:hypothetical protein
MLNSYVDGTSRYVENQYFFDGTAMDALIKWWQKTKDPRVPMVIKLTLDQYYSQYYIALHLAPENADPDPSLHCLTNANWYTTSDDGCLGDPHADQTVLHNLFGFAFAWYWRLSGDDTYRTEGDEVFSHAFDGQDSFKGKTFSQLYRYSFNYVGWRQGWLSPERSIQ